MCDQYRLVGLANSELVAGLAALVRRGNELMAQVLAHLVELEERMLHLELGFSSLFSYCVEGLGMSEGAAGRRVTAARVCRRFSEVFERVARGELHLCALCALASHLTTENVTELLDASRGKTRRQVEELLAARFPLPDVREQIRRLPARPPASMPVAGDAPPAPRDAELASAAEPAQTAVNLPAPSLPAATPVVPNGSRRARELEPLSADRFGVHFTADAELRELIERARALASHRLPNGDLASLMKLAVASFVREEEKRRFGIGARPRRNKGTVETTPKTNKTETNVVTETEGTVRTDSPAPSGGVHTVPSTTELAPSTLGAKLPRKRRHLRLAARRETHERDDGRCAFVSANGRRCSARASLEFDHIVPFARLGGDDASNLRLLCRSHNRWHARRCFGALHIAVKIAAKRRARHSVQSRREPQMGKDGSVS